MKRNIKAFSLTELLVSLVVASILILGIGVLANISYGSSGKLQKDSDLYSGIMYGLKVIQNRTHGATQGLTKINQVSPWVSDQLIVDNESFGFCQLNTSTNLCQAGSSTIGFIHLPDKSNPNNVEVFVLVPNAKTSPVTNFETFNLTLSGLTAKSATLVIKHFKKNQSDPDANITTTVSRRIL